MYICFLYLVLESQSQKKLKCITKIRFSFKTLLRAYTPFYLPIANYLVMYFVTNLSETKKLVDFHLYVCTLTNLLFKNKVTR